MDTKDTEYDRTPLSWAANNRHEAVVKLLFENGAAMDNIERRDRSVRPRSTGLPKLDTDRPKDPVPVSQSVRNTATICCMLCIVIPHLNPAAIGLQAMFGNIECGRSVNTAAGIEIR